MESQFEPEKMLSKWNSIFRKSVLREAASIDAKQIIEYETIVARSHTSYLRIVDVKGKPFRAMEPGLSTNASRQERERKKHSMT